MDLCLSLVNAQPSKKYKPDVNRRAIKVTIYQIYAVSSDLFHSRNREKLFRNSTFNFLQLSLKLDFLN